MQDQSSIVARSFVEITEGGPVPRRVGLLPHPDRPRSPVLAEEIAEQLRAWGLEATIGSLGDEAQREELLTQDLLIVLGGDGATLRVGHVAGPRGVPVLTINMGSLGFLSEVQPADWRAALGRVLEGRYWLEARLMLHAEVERDGQSIGGFELLNEAVVGRGEIARPVRLRTSIDNAYVTTYRADGLIVATATGSTAYALAVGGPILPPTLSHMLLIPIAPHLSLHHPIVLAQGSLVRVEVLTAHKAVFNGDGQYALDLIDGDHVLVGASPHVCRFVRVQEPQYFYRTLMRRLGLEDLDHG